MGGLLRILVPRPWKTGGRAPGIKQSENTRPEPQELRVRPRFVLILKSSNMDRDLGEGLHMKAYLGNSLPATTNLIPGTLLVSLGLSGSGLVLGQFGEGPPPEIFFSTVFSRRALTYAL